MEPTWSEDERSRLALVLERNVAAVLRALRAGDAEGADPPPPLAVLLAACAAGDAIEEATSFAVAQARAAGRTWHEIGEVLAITRQAAQQRFSDRATARDDPENAALAARASQLVEQIEREDWDAVTADWHTVMRTELPVDKLQRVWQQIIETAGALEGVGRPTVKRKGPFRIAEVPLVFHHGPMRARVTFDHAGMVSGLFLTLPEER